jgi:parallel beta-helix repeat protein
MTVPLVINVKPLFSRKAFSAASANNSLGVKLTRTLIFLLILLSVATVLQARVTIIKASMKGAAIVDASALIFVPENYTSIQEAINAAVPGDTIHVNNGVYHENIIINKTLTLVGEDPETTVIEGSSANLSTVYVYGTNVNDIILRNFTIRGSPSYWGVYLLGSPNCTIENNVISNNHGGIIADSSDNGTFTNNTITGNMYEGLFFFQSSGHTMRNNTISGNLYNFGIEESTFDDDIDKSNLVNGKHIYFLRNETGATIDPNTYPDIGYLALINCSDLTIQDLNFTNNVIGITLEQTNNTILRNNTYANNAVGAAVQDSTNNTLSDNNITNNGQGITLTDSPHNTLRNNNLTANQQHIVISGNELSHFLQDIDTSNTVDTKLVRYIINQTDLTITPNTLPNTGYLGLVNCQNVTVQDLTMQNNILLVAFSQNLTVSENTITQGGISLQDVSNGSINVNTLADGSTAGISIIDSSNNEVATNNITQHANQGMLLGSSEDNMIIENDVAENTIGVELDDSTNNAIIGNNITLNKDYGILLTTSNNNTIYHNNFIDNAVPGWQAVSGNSPSILNNTWDNGYPSGGNFWSDYNGTDQHSGQKQTTIGADAIGDKPYYINFLQIDHYPLMGTFHDYPITMPRTLDIEIVSNSTISNVSAPVWLSSPTQYLQPGEHLLLLSVSGVIGTTGFCRVTIPRSLINGTYTVLVDGQPVVATELAESNSTHAYLYFTYEHSEHEVIIVPEYPLTAACLMIAIIFFATITTTKTKPRKMH